MPDAGGSPRPVSPSAAPQADGKSSTPRKLSATDRQALFQRCARELRRRALLIDPERILELTLLRIEASGPPGPIPMAPESGDSPAVSEGETRAIAAEPPDDWIQRRLGAAIDQARREDRDAAAKEPGPDDHENYANLVEVFFIPPGEGAQAAHAFNSLPRQTRRATLELLLYARPLEECVAEGLAGDKFQLAEMARAGILAIMRIDEAMLAKQPRKKGTRKRGGDA